MLIKKANNCGGAQEECILSGSKENCKEPTVEKTAVARRVDTPNKGNRYKIFVEKLPNKGNKYRILVEKFIQLDANNWPKFQEHLKKLYSA